MKIYKIVAKLASTNHIKEYLVRIYEYEIESYKGKTYIFFEGSNKRMLKKDYINKIENDAAEKMYDFIRLYCYALQEGVEQAKETLINKVREEVVARHDASLRLLTALEESPREEFKQYVD